MCIKYNVPIYWIFWLNFLFSTKWPNFLETKSRPKKEYKNKLLKTALSTSYFMSSYFYQKSNVRKVAKIRDEDEYLNKISLKYYLYSYSCHF